MEFGIISALTNNSIYAEKAKNAAKKIWQLRSPIDLVGNHVDVQSGTWTVRDAGIGHAIDSFFEYSLKAGIYFNDEEYFRIFEEVRKSQVYILDLIFFEKFPDLSELSTNHEASTKRHIFLRS